MDLALKSGELHIINGVEVNCKRMLLRDELKEIQQKKIEEKQKKNLEKKRRKRREKKKRRRLKKKLLKQKEMSDGDLSQQEDEEIPPKNEEAEELLPKNEEKKKKIYESVFEDANKLKQNSQENEKKKSSDSEKKKSSDGEKSHSSDLFKNTSGNLNYKSTSKLSILSNPFKEEIENQEKILNRTTKTSNFFNASEHFSVNSDFKQPPYAPLNSIKNDSGYGNFRTSRSQFRERSSKNNSSFSNNQNEKGLGSHIQYQNRHQPFLQQPQKNSENQVNYLLRSPFLSKEIDVISNQKFKQQQKNKQEFSTFGNFKNIYPQKGDQKIERLYQKISNLSFQNLIQNKSQQKSEGNSQFTNYGSPDEEDDDTRNRSNATIDIKILNKLKTTKSQKDSFPTPLKGFGIHRNIISHTQSERQSKEVEKLSGAFKVSKSGFQTNSLNVSDLMRNRKTIKEAENESSVKSSLKMSEIKGLKDIIEEESEKSGNLTSKASKGEVNKESESQIIDFNEEVRSGYRFPVFLTSSAHFLRDGDETKTDCEKRINSGILHYVQDD